MHHRFLEPEHRGDATIGVGEALDPLALRRARKDRRQFRLQRACVIAAHDLTERPVTRLPFVAPQYVAQGLSEVEF